MELRSIKDSFSFDPRSVQLFRVGLGLYTVFDAFSRFPYLRLFYTDEGIFPRLLLLKYDTGLSLHFANGTYLWAFTLFLIQICCGGALILGVRTSLASLVAMVLSISLHNRFWPVYYGADYVYRWLLFLCVFFPFQGCLDTAIKKGGAYFSPWNLLFFIHAFSLYILSGGLKTSNIWTEDYTALSYVFRLEGVGSVFGEWLLQFPDLLKVLTYLALNIEFFAPWLLILSPLLGKRWWVLRGTVSLVFISFHLGIMATMDLGLFPLLGVFLWLLFIPGEIWDFVELRRFFVYAPRPRVQIHPPVLAFFLLFAIGAWNFSSRSFAEKPLSLVFDSLLLTRDWNFFSPAPLRINLRSSFVRISSDGKKFDVKEAVFGRALNSLYWRHFLMIFFTRHHYSDPLGHYVCRELLAQGQETVAVEVGLWSTSNLVSGERSPERREVSEIIRCSE